MTTIEFDPSWRTADGMFGGYVIARLLQAGMIVEGFWPLSISAQFLGGVLPGGCEVRADVVHRGALTAVVQLDLVQKHRRAMAVVKLGRGSPDRIIDQREQAFPRAGPEGLPRLALPYGPFPYEQHLETRLVPDPRVRQCERTSGWVRMSSVTAVDLELAAACVLLDTLPPGLFFADPAPSFVPTVDFTAHFAPAVEWSARDWVFLVQDTRWSTRDFCAEEASLYTPDGVLIAQARQARRVRWPDK